MPWFSVFAVVLSAVSAPQVQSRDLAFHRADEPGFYTFDTGVLRGKVRMNGSSQGVVELIHIATDTPIVCGGRLPGVFSPYRVFGAGKRYGKAARDWPTKTKILAGGALEVFWPPGEGHPLEMTAVYRWVEPDTLDLQLTVKPQEDMPAFELFMSSYFEKTFLARVYLKSAGGSDEPRLVPADRKPKSRGGYVMFPRDEAALKVIKDGRWAIPPNPVDWWIDSRLAAPLALRRDTKTGVTAVMMAPPDDCFAVSSPFNPASPDAGGYRSLYQSLFGRDLAAGRTDTVRMRLAVGKDVSDADALKLYRRYLDEVKRQRSKTNTN